ncbi:hypothetical protein [Latilactobacillus curvatus]|uniref:hypothetical protein n=1 Tax=Latilactobacillus curvatus TaxID=28038 RepID=UPI0023DB5F62|nr:hypothetical protein [Latilactobacillus curvatus]
MFKRNKEPLNTVDHCGGNRGVVLERRHAQPSVTPHSSYKQWDGWMWVPMPGL